MWLPEQRMPITAENRTELIINCIVVLIVLIVVTLRVIGRLWGPGLGMDDVLVMIATPMGVAMLICQGVFTTTGSGHSLEEHPERMSINTMHPSQKMNPRALSSRASWLFRSCFGHMLTGLVLPNVPWILEVSFGMQPVYITLLALCKASMLCFFLRVFPTRFMRTASKIALGFVVAWNVSCVLTSIFLCNPISAQWTGKGKCGAYIPFIQSLIATNAVGDVIIMALPMRSLWHLQKRTAEKLAIMSCFSLGIACVVCAIFRFIYISTVDLTHNVTGTMPTTILLFILEPNLAILCVSIPMLGPFLTMYKKRVGGSRLDEDSYENSGQFASTTANTKKSKKGSLSDSQSTWELNNYRPQAQCTHDAEVFKIEDESASERNLTGSSVPKDEIMVETVWTVHRS